MIGDGHGIATRNRGHAVPLPAPSNSAITGHLCNIKDALKP